MYVKNIEATQFISISLINEVKTCSNYYKKTKKVNYN